MTNSLKTLSVLTFGAVCSILAITVPARSVLAQVTLTSTVAQSGFNGPQNRGEYPLTASAYNFTTQDYLSLASVDTVSVTLRVTDGDTAAGTYDIGDLTLGLDGINSGILLNGFPNNLTRTLTFSGVPNDPGLVLAALQADGQLVGSVFDSDPNDGDDNIAFPLAANVTNLTILGEENTQEGGGTPIPFELSPGLGFLALGLWGGMAQLKSKLQKQKSSVSAFSQH